MTSFDFPRHIACARHIQPDPNCRMCQEVKRQDDWFAWRGVYPGMCVDPETCRGYGHCPRDYSCSE